MELTRHPIDLKNFEHLINLIENRAPQNLDQ